MSPLLLPVRHTVRNGVAHMAPQPSMQCTKPRTVHALSTLRTPQRPTLQSRERRVFTAAGAGDTSSTAGAAGAATDAGAASAAAAARDKWEDVLATKHTLSSLYRPKVNYVEFKQIDHAEKRRKREVREICEAGRKLGIKEASITEGILRLQALLPDMAPNLDKMKASQWASLLSDPNKVATVIITLRSAYPRANVSALLQRAPKLLLKDCASLQADAAAVRAMLLGMQDVDSVVEQVPYLTDPAAVAQSISNLRRWFPNQDPLVLLQNNPTMLLNIDEADLEADPLYGLAGDWAIMAARQPPPAPP